jgi:hypothetical protein
MSACVEKVESNKKYKIKQDQLIPDPRIIHSALVITQNL